MSPSDQGPPLDDSNGAVPETAGAEEQPNVNPTRDRTVEIRKKFARVLERVAFQIAPEFGARLAGRRFLGDDTGYLDREDAESFATAQIPNGEVVGMRAVWIMEIYLSSHVPNLIRGLQRLGLHEVQPWESDPIESITESRSIAAGRSINLGILVPRIRGRFAYPHTTPADLPEGVTSAFLQLVAPVPGVSVLVAQFRFDEETARGLEEPFRTEYKAKAVLREKTLFYPMGAHLRDEAVEDYRANLRRRCARWMNENLPGSFAGFENEPIPACELLTFEIGDPLGGRTPATMGADGKPIDAGAMPENPLSAGRGSGEEDYLGILGQRDDVDAWACAQFSGLVLRLPRGKLFHAEDHLVLSARTTSFGDDKRQFFDRKDRTPEGVASLTYWLDETLAVFALARVLIAYERRLGRLRDALGTVTLERTSKAVSQMERLEREVALIARDARPLLHGIESAPARAWKREVYTFFPIDEFRKKNAPLFEAIANGLVERSTRMIAAEKETRETAQTISVLIAASANLKAARANIRLQVAVIALTIVTIFLAALAVPDDWPARLRALVAKIT